MKVRVTTGSRLHFGLFRLPGQQPKGVRQCGGVGLMIEHPGLAVCAEPANSSSVVGAVQERAQDLISKVVRACSLDQAFHLEVESCPRQHVGLGTGTQLSLAIALALTRASGQHAGPTLDVLDLAQGLGRGQRSALGIHGFMQGGFLVDGGKGPATAVAPLVARAEFPEDWRVLLIVPPGEPGCHGPNETQAFADLARHGAADSECDALCRLTLLGMLPALKEADLPAFGESLYEFNRRVGEMFRPAQGGVYGHRITAELVTFLRQQNVHGTGQSSWGPTVFAIAEADRAEHLAQLVRERSGFQETEIIVTRARNRGASCISAEMR
jgi:beta-RFAP synthase